MGVKPFSDVNITPNYAKGFAFLWSLHPGFSESAPFEFTVEEAETNEGPWVPISPLLADTYVWYEDDARIAPKDPSLYFRIRLECGGAVHYSHVVTPYGDMSRREFLIARDIMRQEILQQRKLTGTECVVWRKSVFGPACTKCTDFVTGEPVTGSCEYCFGTGRNPGYHGPYPIWVTFSVAQRDKGMQNDQTGVNEPYAHNGRVVGTIRLNNDDVIVDTNSDKRYFVDVVNNVIELRRYPLVQSVTLNQIAVTHVVYRLGS